MTDRPSNSIRDVIFNRWPERFDAIPWMAPAKNALDRILAIEQRVRREHAALQKNEHLTPLGRGDALRKVLTADGWTSPAAALHITRKFVSTMRERLAAERAKLTPQPPDKADVSAAVLRSEMRTMLRGMKPMERIQLLLSDGADQTMLSAVLEAPNISSGISDDIRAKVTRTAMERINPGAADKLDDYDEAAALVDAAYKITLATVQRACDFPSERLMSDFLDASVTATDKTKNDSVTGDALKDFGNIAKAEPATVA